MSIIEHLKGAQDMKKMKEELIATPTWKHERKVQMEPLQYQEAQLITQLEEEKRNMVKAQAKGATIIQEEITMQTLEVLTEKSM
jgi:hypothetical protein